MSSYGWTNLYVDAELAYRQEQIMRDFAAINHAAQQRADRRAHAAESRAAGQSAPVATPASGPTAAPARRTWIARVFRTPHPPRTERSFD